MAKPNRNPSVTCVKSFYIFTVVNKWNSLPTYVVSANTLNCRMVQPKTKFKELEDEDEVIVNCQFKNNSNCKFESLCPRSTPCSLYCTQQGLMSHSTRYYISLGHFGDNLDISNIRRSTVAMLQAIVTGILVIVTGVV